MVPHKLVNEIVIARIMQNDCGNKEWSLRGYPGTGPQAKIFSETGMILDVVICIEASDDIIMDKTINQHTI